MSRTDVVAMESDPLACFVEAKEPNLTGTFSWEGRIQRVMPGDLLTVLNEPMELPMKGELVLALPPGETDETVLGQWRKRGGALVVVPLNGRRPPFNPDSYWPVLMVQPPTTKPNEKTPVHIEVGGELWSDLAGTFTLQDGTEVTIKEKNSIVLDAPTSLDQVECGRLVLTNPLEKHGGLLARCQQVGDEVMAVPADGKGVPFVPDVVWPVLQINVAV
jgi:hypothetical protein